MSVYVGKLVEKKNGPWRFKTLFGFLQILSLLLLQEEKFENSVFITLNEFSEAVIYQYQIYHHHYIQSVRTWQPFVGDKNGHENFRQARIYNFRDKCVVYARNRKFANLTQ